jgi:macrolide-specific efflux system membrane fusion protein
MARTLNPKKIKPVWRYALAGLLFGIILYSWAPWHSGRDTNAKVELVPVTRGDMEETVTAQGKLEPKEFVDVGSQVSGQLQKLHVEIGDTVKKGDIIAEIDPKIYTAKVAADEAGLNSLRAQLAEQQAQVAFTESVYKRNQKLVKADAVAKETLESSLKEYKAAQARSNSFAAQIKQAESTLQADKANLGYTKIYAPIAGTVVSQTSKEGQTLNANQTAPVIVQVANLNTMTVRAQVAEADVSRLKEGMEVYFNTLGSERRWTSTLRQLLPSPDSTVTDVVLYNALVDVDNPDHVLMTGMSTQMFFLLGSADKALVIPARALGKKLPSTPDAKGETYEVQVATQDGLEARPVQIGLLNRTQAEVLSGLSEGDKVAAPKSASAAGAAPAARRVPRM